MDKTQERTVDLYKEVPAAKEGRLKFTSSSPFVPTYVQSQLTLSSDPADTYASRIKGRQILLENPVKESRTKKLLEEKKARKKVQNEKKKAGVIGKKEAKVKGVWRLDEAQAKWSLFLPLHHLWMGYMSELLGLRQLPTAGTASKAQDMPPSASMHPKLVKADFHGSIMTVRQSKNPCLIGLSGIVIHETENAFKIINEANKVKMLPKQGTIFSFAVPLYSTLPADYDSKMPFPIPPPPRTTTTEDDASTLKTVLQLPHIEFDLHGNQFRFRSADRASRKFKHKETIEL